MKLVHKSGYIGCYVAARSNLGSVCSGNFRITYGHYGFKNSNHVSLSKNGQDKSISVWYKLPAYTFSSPELQFSLIWVIPNTSKTVTNWGSGTEKISMATLSTITMVSHAWTFMLTYLKFKQTSSYIRHFKAF